jgi:hypothetical protein
MECYLIFANNLAFSAIDIQIVLVCFGGLGWELNLKMVSKIVLKGLKIIFF